MSFYDRVERMWPDAWDWIARRETSPSRRRARRHRRGPALVHRRDGLLRAGPPRLCAVHRQLRRQPLRLYLYAQFGVFRFMYILHLLRRALKLERRYRRAGKALAILSSSDLRNHHEHHRGSDRRDLPGRKSAYFHLVPSKRPRDRRKSRAAPISAPVLRRLAQSRFGGGGGRRDERPRIRQQLHALRLLSRHGRAWSFPTI